MSLSVRDIAAARLGKTGDLSIDADVFGYVHRDAGGTRFGALTTDDVLPRSGTATEPTHRSLKRHLETISGPAVDLVMFLVDHRPDFSGEVTQAQVARAQFGLQVARDIYASQDIGIRRIEWGYISPELAGRYADIGSSIEAGLITAEFSGRPGAIDVFVVQTIDNSSGWGPPPLLGGPCDKDSLLMSGVVVDLSVNTSRFFGISIGHEVGHYLGLEHTSSSTNLMYDPGNDDPDVGPQMVGLSVDQAAEMSNHCMMLQT